MRVKDYRKYWMWLSHACGAGSKTAVSLIRHFGNVLSIYNADEDDFAKCNFRIDSRVKARLLYKDIEEEENIVDWCDSCSVRIICPDDPEYPSSLRGLLDAPMVLYCLGTLPDLSEDFCCAVVGTRTMSAYGDEMAYKMGNGLVTGGSILASGLAIGCDSSAIKGALDAGGTVVAVLGCGIDVVYPKENRRLFERVLEKGAIITEYAPGVSPLKTNFPVRNRIISGISQAVCVIEGSMRSGSLITARHAVYQGREVFAIPGKVGEENSEGTNFLIKTGAAAVTSAEDILVNFELLYPHSIEIKNVRILERIEDEPEKEVKVLKKKKAKAKKKVAEKDMFEDKPRKTPIIDFETLGETEKTVYRAMTPDIPMLAEEICNASGVAIATVMASLTMLEMTGAVESGAGGYFMRHADDEEVGEPAITELDEGL